MKPLVQRLLAFALVLAACLVAGVARAGQEQCPAGMLFVPGGHFLEGSEQGFPDEQPVQSREVASFCLDRTEVTTGAYERCVREGRCERAGARAAWPELVPGEGVDWTEYCNGERPDRADHPINCVTWSLADSYCRAQGQRLPSELEFEYAARGGDQQRTYPWGEEPPDETRLNACGTECSKRVAEFHGGWSTLYDASDGFRGSAPVGSFPLGRGRWGHEDLSGNVWEWTIDVYCPYGDDFCWSDERSVRGSGFLQISLLKVRAHRRNHDVGWHSSGDLGFRCATSVDGPNPPARATIPPFTLEFQPRGSATWLLALLACVLLVGGAGWVLGYLGGGGSVIIVPIMLFAVGVTKEAAPVWTLAIVCATAAVSAAFHARASRVDVRAALAFAPGAVSGAYLGGQVARFVPYPVVIVGFLLVMAGTARAMLRAPRRQADAAPPRRAWLVRGAVLVGASIAIGLTSGILGIGSGLLIVPVLTLLAGLPIPRAVGTSTFIISLTAAAALVPQRHLRVDYTIIAGLAVACAAGTVLGARRTGKTSPERLRRSFGALVLVAGSLVLVRQAIPAVRDYVRARANAELSGRSGG
jgi:formylglycine-generating enzyme required for sulfatase activity/uncharacterized membrane protein YfcA